VEQVGEGGGAWWSRSVREEGPGGAGR